MISKEKYLLKSFIFMCLSLSVLVVTAFLIMCAAYLLPIDRIENNVASSAKYIQREGSYPNIKWWTTQLDNVTDSAMLLISASDVQEPIFTEAMSSHLGVIIDTDLAGTIVRHYMDGQEFDRIGSYSRYWHGYLVFLRPLLFLTNYMGIRIINGLAQVLLIFIICRLLNKNGKREFTVYFLISYCMLMPIALALSLQFSTCFYVSMIGIVVVFLVKDAKLNEWGYLLFLLMGAVTSFLDFLTYPIATLGIPLIFLMIKNTDLNLKKRLVSIVTNAFSWGFGYTGMWGAKWILATLFTEKDVISDAIETFFYRTSAQGGNSVRISRLSCELRNYGAFLKTPVTIILFVVIIILIIKIKKIQDKKNIEIIQIFLPYCVIAIMPIAWYAFALEHSYVHFWFTNKACAVSFLAIMVGLQDVLSRNMEGKALE